MVQVSKKFKTAMAVVISAAAGLAAAQADAVSPVVTHSLDTTVAASLGEKFPETMRGGTWKVIYSSAEGPEGRALEVLTKRAGTYFLRCRSCCRLRRTAAMSSTRSATHS